MGFALASVVVATAGGLQQGPVRAQVPDVALAQSPPSTLGLLDGLLNELFPSTTVPPPVAPAPAPEAGAAVEPAPPSGPATSQSSSASEPRVVPPEAQRVIDSVRRTGSRNTLALMEALGLLESVGFTAEEAAIAGMGQFPVAGEAYYRDDWLEARFTPSFHHHMGTDIFAARGTPVRAPADGVVRLASEAVGGLSAYVTMADGTFYYMTHLDRFSRDIRSGQRVARGTVVGFVGSSGNAEGGSPHVHFEVRPRGGAAVNPKPILDRWIEEALAGAPALLSGFEVSVPRAISAAGLLRRFDVGSFSGGASGDRGPQLWAASVRSSAGQDLPLARFVAGPRPARPGPAAVASLVPAGLAGDHRSMEMARAVLGGVTPPVIESMLSGGTILAAPITGIAPSDPP